MCILRALFLAALLAFLAAAQAADTADERPALDSPAVQAHGSAVDDRESSGG